VKEQLYARFGVKEYWLIDPGNNRIEIFALEAGKYKLLSSATGRGKVRSVALDIEFTIAEVAPEDE
jgi:Uma2 family endonuclease